MEENKITEQKVIYENGRKLDITDPKWGRPSLREPWIMNDNGFNLLYRQDIPMEQKNEILRKLDYSAWITVTDQDYCDVREYEVPGCPEEPDLPAKAIVYTPKGIKRKKGVIFYGMGGGLVHRDHSLHPLPSLCKKFDCIVITCDFRTSLEAPYPAAINDHHAVYQWMIENAEMLHINTDKIVFYGGSAGGMLVTAFAFRFKRYNWCGGLMPRGIVAVNPITDDRQIYPCSQIYTNRMNADGENIYDILSLYLGRNFGSNRVGPEALANHAMVEECIGYPPLFLHTGEFDPDRDYNREFVGKIYAAKSFCEYHCWGGAHHASLDQCNAEVSELYHKMVDANIQECFESDLRRPWVLEGN